MTILAYIVSFILYILANIRKIEKFPRTDRQTNLLIEDPAGS